MNIAVIVDIKSDRKDGGEIIVSHVNRKRAGDIVESTSETDYYNEIGLMNVLCEGVVTLIHSANNSGLKKDYESLRDCISYLEKGFADPTYRGVMEKDNLSRMFIDNLNLVITTTPTKTPNQYAYLIRNAIIVPETDPFYIKEFAGFIEATNQMELTKRVIDLAINKIQKNER